MAKHKHTHTHDRHLLGTFLKSLRPMIYLPKPVTRLDSQQCERLPTSLPWEQDQGTPSGLKETGSDRSLAPESCVFFPAYDSSGGVVRLGGGSGPCSSQVFSECSAFPRKPQGRGCGRHHWVPGQGLSSFWLPFNTKKGTLNKRKQPCARHRGTSSEFQGDEP